MKTEAVRSFPKLLAAIKLGLAVIAIQADGQTNITPEQAAFFESKIRPVLGSVDKFPNYPNFLLYSRKISALRAVVKKDAAHFPPDFVPVHRAKDIDSVFVSLKNIRHDFQCLQ